ncbi:MAG: multiubiquitin domain-containing protein [Solirubrobacterales bacterium]
MGYSLTIDENSFQTDDPVLTGRQLLELAGRSPAEEHVVLELGERRQLEDIDLEESVDLREPGRELFFTFRTDRLFNFVLDGQRQPWGSGSISESVLRRLAGIGEGDHVWLERRDEPDFQLAPGQEIPLDPAGVESFYTQRAIAIIVNGRRKVVEQRSLTFDELLALAFDPVPEGPFWCFTVTYRNGPRPNPEGTLIVGQSVRITNGMVFNVSATDKS